MKKFLLILAALVMVLSMTTVSFADADMTEYNRASNHLISIGVSPEFLNTMESEDVVSMYNDIKDLNVGDVSYEKTEMVIEDNQLTRADHYLSGSDMTLSISALTTYQLGSTKDKILGTRIYATYVWHKQPAIRRGDMGTINWNSAHWAYGASSYTHKIYKKVLQDYSLWKTYKAPTKTAQGGIGFSAPFAETVVSVKYTKGIITFDLNPTGGAMYKYSTTSKNDIQSNININYVHDGTPVVSGISFSVAGGKVGINSSSSAQTYSTSSTASVRFGR